jgi:hypothetical protein
VLAIYICIYIISTVNEANVGSSLKRMDATGKKKTLRLAIIAKDPSILSNDVDALNVHRNLQCRVSYKVFILIKCELKHMMVCLEGYN